MPTIRVVCRKGLAILARALPRYADGGVVDRELFVPLPPGYRVRAAWPRPVRKVPLEAGCDPLFGIRIED